MTPHRHSYRDKMEVRTSLDILTSAEYNGGKTSELIQTLNEVAREWDRASSIADVLEKVWNG